MILFHLVDPAERDLPGDGAATFEDAESGERLPLRPRRLREKYQALVAGAPRRARAALAPGPGPTTCALDDRPAARSWRCTPISSAAGDESGALMGLGFLVPAFLAGLAALLVPLVLHLRHRERDRP